MADGYIHRPSMDEKVHHDPEKSDRDYDRKTSIVTAGEVVNASGHRDQLQRQYGLISICGLALTIDNAWVALGGSIAVSISMHPQKSSESKDGDVLIRSWQTMVGQRACCTSFLSRASIMASSLRQLQRYLNVTIQVRSERFC